MKTIKTVVFVLTVVTLAGCTFGNEPELDNGIPSGFFLSSIDIEVGDTSGTSAARSSGISASAAVPHWDEEADVEIADGASGTLFDYPMVGQVTNYSVTAVDSPDGEIFRVVSVTTYPYNPHIDNTTEIYFLKDVDGDLAFTNNLGEAPVDNPDASLYREQYSTTYAGDYAIYSRDEEIVWESNTVTEYEYRSRVEYNVENRSDSFGFLKLDGVREYFNVDGSEERIEVTETGTVTNMNWNGRVYRGNTTVNGTIFLEIVDREVVEQNVEYVLRHRDLAEDLVITF